MKKNYKRLILSLLAVLSLSANASTVSLKTSKAVGEEITIAVNAVTNVTLTWGNGTVVTFASDGAPVKVTVADQSLVITTDNDLTALFLNEDGLTELTMTDAATLQRLFCAGNELKTLNLSACTSLKELDCQDNQLTSLTLANTLIEDINVAGNNLTSMGLKSSYVKNIRSIVCASNKLASVSYLTSMANLRSLFCQDNSITNLAVSSCVNLRSLIAANNNLKTFNGKQLKAIKNLWINDNQLDSVNLSAATILTSLVVKNNNMSLIVWNKSCSSTLSYADLSENQLFFNSFPTAYSSAQSAYRFPITLLPQRDYKLCDYAVTDTDYEAWRTVFYRNGFNTGPTATLTITDKYGYTLQKNTDFTYSSARLKFLTPHELVLISAKSTYYPDVTLNVAPFPVHTADGIELVSSDKIGANEIYTLSGVRVNNTDRLPKGIYIINGKKTVVK